MKRDLKTRKEIIKILWGSYKNYREWRESKATKEILDLLKESMGSD